MKKGYFFKATLLSGVIVLLVSSWFISKIFVSNTAFPGESILLYVSTGSDFNELTQRLEQKNILESPSTFLLTAKLKRFRTVKPGRYRIIKGMSNNALVNMLRSGNQESVMVKLDGVQTLPQLAGRLAQYLERDSSSFAAYLLDPDKASSFGFNKETFPSMFIADTYELLWTTSGDEFMNRMSKEYKSVWNDERKAKAAMMNLSPNEISTLASIVKGETGQLSEAPVIAGLYLNRLKSGIPLQSDPTVIFATGLSGVQRVLYSDLSSDSPYNTYKHTGLPPGPISLVEKKYIDAVLNAERNDYLYMCAQPGNTGLHNFARTYEQHQVNAILYRKWLDKNGIKR